MKRYALLMACDEYEHFKECPFCQADSEEILDTLVNYCDYSYESTQMLGLYSHDDEITPTYIFEVIQKILEQCEIDDTLLVYFAGHGLLEEESGNMYLVLPRSDPDTLESTGINLNSLYQLLSSGKGNSFLILDACHSGSIPWIELSRSFILKSEKSNCILLASCAADEVSNPIDEHEHGAFTYFFSESIRESNPENDLMIENIKIETCNKIRKWCEETGISQTPTLMGKINGNISFARRNNKTVAEHSLQTIQEASVSMTTDVSIVPVNDQNSSVSLWKSNTGVLIPKTADAKQVLSLNRQLKETEIKTVVFTYTQGLFEGTAETIWSRSMHILRTWLLGFGEQFVSEMTGIDNIEIVRQLPEYETIKLAMDLGFIDATGKMRLTHAKEIVEHYRSREVNEEMPLNEIDTVIRACIQYVLAYDDVDVRINYIDFRNKLVSENLDDSVIGMIGISPYFYKKTTIRTLVNLLASTSGAEFETVQHNFKNIITTIWTTLPSDDRYSIGLEYSKNKNAGDTDLTMVYYNTLMNVHGFDYVPENLRSMSFVSVAKRIRQVHYEMNNFYNEPAEVKKLDRMGTRIPKPAIKECIGAVLLVCTGNRYGVSFNAIGTSKAILSKMTKEDWRYYLEECLTTDEEVLANISDGNSRSKRWCDLCKEYNVEQIEFSNSQITDFIKHSTEGKLAIVGIEADKMRNRLM